jgi:Holliday junction resolvasome RuvABC endonuclease subunit
MTIILGVDVGISGALAAIEVGDMGSIELIDCIDIPTCSDHTNRQIDVVAFGAFIERITPDIAYIENVTPMPSIGPGPARSMGATSAFRFGMACGAIRAVVAAYSIPYRLVTPQVWKRASGFLKGANKEASRQLALRVLPECAPFLKRKLDHNRADALLLALYGANQKGML